MGWLFLDPWSVSTRIRATLLTDGSVTVGMGGEEEDRGRLFMEAAHAWLIRSSSAPWHAHGRQVQLSFAEKLHLFNQNRFAFWEPV